MVIKKKLKEASLSVGSLLVGFLLCEALVRGLGFAPVVNRLNPGLKKTVYRLSENPVLGYVFKENYRDTDNPDLNNSYPAINSKGFRDNERS